MRKLVWVAAGFACALSAAVWLLPESWQPWAGCVCAALALCALALRKTITLRPTLALFAASVGFLWCWGYTQLFVVPALNWADREAAVTVCISDYAHPGDGYGSVEALCIDDAMPRGKMRIYDYGGDSLLFLRPGDTLRMPLKLLNPRERYQEESDYYLSSAIHYRAYLTGEYEAVGRARLAAVFLPRELCQKLKSAALSCFPEDVAPLMKALLTGDKTEFYRDEMLYTAMRSAGFLHIVAVSGMHVAFLVSLVELLAGRRRAALIGIPVLVVFMAMLGFTPSVTRAGIMQIVLLLAPLLRREADPPTSLALAALVLLACNPYAIASQSLQMSFGAVLGLQLVSPRIYRGLVIGKSGKSRLPKNALGRILDWVISTFSASVGALVFTTPLTALYSGFVPLYSILTNLLCLWAMSAAFLCGYAVCFLGLLWQPFGFALGYLIALLPRYVIFVVKRIAMLPMSVLVTKHNLAAWWLAFVYVLFVLTYALRGKKPYRPLIPVGICAVTLLLVLLLARQDLSGQLEVTAVDVGQGASIAAMTERGTVVIDCGSTGSADNAGDLMANYLLGKGRKQVDLLVLTHFHADHANGVRRLMGRIPVRQVALSPECEHTDYYTDILDACEQQGVSVCMLTENTLFRIDQLELTLIAPMGSESANERCLMAYGDFGDFEFLFTGDVGSSVERKLMKSFPLGDMELLVVGHHGSRYSTCEELLDDITPEYAFISCGVNNSYGHPAPEVLERLEERKIQVLRTDLDGTVTIRVGSEHGEETGKQTQLQ